MKVWKYKGKHFIMLCNVHTFVIVHLFLQYHYTNWRSVMYEYMLHNELCYIWNKITTCRCQATTFSSGTHVQGGITSLTLGVIKLYRMGRDSSVGRATRYGLDGPGIESHWGRDFPHPSRPAQGHTQPPVQWVPCSGRGVVLTIHPHLSAEVMKG
jgi:hypothetical protein